MAAYNTKTEKKLDETFFDDKHLPCQNCWANLFFQIKPIILTNSINHIRQNPDTPGNRSTNEEKTAFVLQNRFV